MAKEKVATASIEVQLDTKAAWSNFQKETKKQAKESAKTFDSAFGKLKDSIAPMNSAFGNMKDASKTLNSAFGKMKSTVSSLGGAFAKMAASQGKLSQSGFSKTLADAQTLRQTVPAVSNMFSTLQDQVRAVGGTSHATFVTMAAGVMAVRKEGMALSLVLTGLQEQVRGLGKHVGGALSGAGGKGTQNFPIAQVGAGPKAMPKPALPLALPAPQKAAPSAGPAAAAPAAISALSKMHSQLRGMGTTTAELGAAFAKTFGNLEKRSPALAEFVKANKEAFAATRDRAQAAFAKHVTPRINTGSGMVRDVRDMAGMAGGAIKRKAGDALSGARSRVSGALAPVGEKMQGAQTAIANQLKAISIQSQRVGRAMAKDFQPLIAVFGKIGTQASDKLFKPLGSAAGTAAQAIRTKLQAVLSTPLGGNVFAKLIPSGALQMVNQFGSAVRGVGGILASVGKTAVSTGAQATTQFFGTMFRRSIGLAQSAIKGLAGSVGAVAGKIRGMMTALKSTLLPLAALAGGLSVVGTTIASVNTFANFEQGMARVKALTNANAGEFDMLGKKAEELGAKTMFSATQAAEAMGNFAQSGFKVNEIMGAVGPALDLAAAGQLDMATAADITSKVMRGMQIDVSKLGHVTDVLAKAFTTSNTDLQMLGEAMNYVGPVATTANKSLEETVATLQVLADAGLQASLGGTTLRGMYSQLAQEGKGVKSVFGDLGVKIKDSFGNLRPMADIVDDFNAAVKKQGKEADVMAMAMEAFGDRAGPGFAVLLGKGGAALRQYEKNLEGAAGTAKRIAETQMNTLKGSFDELSSAAEGAMISFGAALAPSIRGVAETLTGLMPVIGEIAASIQPLADKLGQALSGRIKALTGFLSENKGEFAKWFELTSEIFTNITTLVGEATAAFTKFIASTLGLEGKGLFSGAVEGITAVLDAMSLVTTDAMVALGTVPQALMAGAEYVGAMILDHFTLGINTFADTIDSVFNRAIAGIGSVLAAFVESLPLVLSKTIELAKSDAGKSLGKLALSMSPFANRGIGAGIKAGMEKQSDVERLRKEYPDLPYAIAMRRDQEKNGGAPSQEQELTGAFEKAIAGILGAAKPPEPPAPRDSDMAFYEEIKKPKPGDDLRESAASRMKEVAQALANLSNQRDANRQKEAFEKQMAENFKKEEEQREEAEKKRDHVREAMSPVTGFISKAIASASTTVATAMGPQQAAMLGTKGLGGTLGEMLNGAAQAAKAGVEMIVGKQEVRDIKGGQQSDTLSYIQGIQSDMMNKRKEEAALKASQKTQENTKGLLDKFTEFLNNPKMIVGTFGR